MSDLAQLWQHVRNLHARLDQFEEIAKKESPVLARAINQAQADRQRALQRDVADDRPEDLQNSEHLRDTLVKSIKATGRIPESVEVGGDPGWSGPEVNR